MLSRHIPKMRCLPRTGPAGHGLEAPMTVDQNKPLLFMSRLSQVCHRKQTTTVTEATVLLLAWIQARYFQALGLLFKKLKQKFAHLLRSSRTLFKAKE